MKIGVFGNINAGKSYIVQKLRSLFPNYTVAQIDKMRQKYGDGSTAREMLAQKEFVATIQNTNNVIFEFTGYGKIADSLYTALDDSSIIVLNIKAKKEICLERLTNKDFSLIPYPYKENICDTIRNLSKVLDEQNFIRNFWLSKSRAMFDISSDEPLEYLNLYQYQ